MTIIFHVEDGVPRSDNDRVSLAGWRNRETCYQSRIGGRLLRFTSEMFQLITNGRKTQTTRRIKSLERYKRKIGRIIKANSKIGSCNIKILDCNEKELGEVINQDFLQEGFTTSEEFRKVWKSIYHSFDPTEKVCIIKFESTGKNMILFVEGAT